MMSLRRSSTTCRRAAGALRGLLADPNRETLADRAPTRSPTTSRPGGVVYQSVDIQIAAPTRGRIAAGDYLAVIGDVHPGDNPLMQGLFANRFPGVAQLMDRFGEDVGSRFALLLPPWGPGMQVDARGIPTPPDDTVYIGLHPDAQAPGGARTWARRARVDGGTSSTAPANCASRCSTSSDCPSSSWPCGRSSCSAASARAAPDDRPYGAAARAVGARRRRLDDPRLLRSPERGMPRRVFAKSPTTQAVLPRLRQPGPARIRRATLRPRPVPAVQISFSEMLPAPDECWLSDAAGRRYASDCGSSRSTRPGFRWLDRAERGGCRRPRPG